MTTTYAYEVKVNNSTFGSEFFSVEGYLLCTTYGYTRYLDKCITVSNLINPTEISIGMSTTVTGDIDKAKVMVELYAKVIEVAEEELVKRVKGE